MEATYFLILILGVVHSCKGWTTHSSSSSLYLHSNDTFTLVLSDDHPNELHQAPGGQVDLYFTLTNYERGMVFYTITQESEDGFRGILDTTSVGLQSGQKQDISVRRMTVPQRKDGEKVRFTLTATRQINNGYGRRKRQVGGSSSSTDWNNGGSVGGSSNVGGSGSYNPGGSVGGSSSVGGSGSYNPGGSGNYNPGGSNSYNPGGSNNYNPGGSNSYNPGGSGNYNPGGGSYNPGGSGNYNPGGVDWNNNDPGYNDPSHRREASVTLEFTVTDDYEEDDNEPWYKIEYGADDEEDLCTITPGNPGCDQQWWWAKFRVQDEDSGLKSVKVEPTGKQTYAEAVYYRHVNFPIGTNAEHEVIAAASCCIEGMRLTVQDVAGETAEAYALWDGTGSPWPLSKPAIYGIIGAVAGVLLIVVIVIAVVCYKKKYQAVSQNP